MSMIPDVFSRPFVRACALIHGAIALVAGLCVGYQFRHQTAHAVPWAIWTAGVASSLPAALCAALCAAAFDRQRKLFVAALGSLCVCATATLAAASLYALLSGMALASDGDWITPVQYEVARIPELMLMYILTSAICWVPALPIGVVVLRRMS